jgi:soluble lytic murein transglycosylase
MFSRFLIFSSLLLLLTVPASGLSIYQLPDAALTAAAAKMKVRDFRGAREAALQAPMGGTRDFLLGMVAARLGEWEQAADLLEKGATGFPLLADYALYNRANALHRLARYPEALAAVQGLVQNYPESPLARAAEKLLADVLYDAGNFPAALPAYEKFIERYAAGPDALAALHRLALCREKTTDLAGAVAALRKIWLNYPASSLAAKSEEDLRRLAESGAKAAPYTAEELLRRGTTLADLRKFDQAIKTFTAIPLEGQSADFVSRLLLKTGQAQFKARRYKDAEQTFARLGQSNLKKGTTEEARFWLGRSQEKNGKDEEAFATYLKLVESYPDSTLADDALLEAAYIRKSQKKGDDQLTFLRMLVESYPRSNVVQTARWEIAWRSYQAGDLKAAAANFKKLLDGEKTRERALYWYGRTLAAAGDGKGAEQAFASLLGEYPLGYYALTYRKEAKIADGEALSLAADLCTVLPVPDGLERAKALIALGLFDEAGKELGAARKRLAGKPKLLPGLARLYLEMEDFNGAFALCREERPRNLDKNSLALWGIAYPMAFREAVGKYAAKTGVPESLIYSVIRAESGYSPTALSPVGAVGLMQLMPATAATIAGGGGEKFTPDHLTRPEFNIRFGIKHLKDLLVLYDGDVVAAVAAYNAGSGNVNRWRKQFGNLPQDEFIECITFGETRDYVKKVLAGVAIYNRLYGLPSPPDRNRSATSPRKQEPLPSPPAAAALGT